MLKELKEAVAKYGPASPYVKHVISNAVGGFPWTPHDYKEVMSAVLTPGQYGGFQGLRKEGRREIH